MPQISTEIKVKDTCDTLILWVFCCSEKAAFLVKRKDSPEYAIMCEEHKKDFERIYPNEKVVYHAYSLALNQQFADEANGY